MCGTKSGKDIDKLKLSGFTPCASKFADSPSFEEAELVMECRKMYYGDFDPAKFLLPEIAKVYTSNDYHRMYLGEIIHIEGTEKYSI